jgi:3-oxoacyl-[acyl-carrier-protein] synthase-3
MKIGIKGKGFYIPEKRVSLEDIAQKAGIHPKVIEAIGSETVSEAKDNELPSDMAVIAAKKAIEDAGINPLNIDIIINSPAGLQDYIIPPISGKVQYEIGAENAVCFDLVQGCCGMLTGIQIAKNYVLSGEAENILVVSSDKWSGFTSYHSADAVIFGDGAGAVVIGKDSDGLIVEDLMFKTNGKYFDLYGIENGGVKNIDLRNSIIYKCLKPDVAKKEFKDIYMNEFINIAKKILNKNTLKVENIDYLSIVNANLKLLEYICSKLNFPLEKSSAEYLKKHGHIGGFDIFYNIFLAKQDGKLKKGDKILLLNAGIGFTWGAGILIQ